MTELLQCCSSKQFKCWLRRGIIPVAPHSTLLQNQCLSKQVSPHCKSLLHFTNHLFFLMRKNQSLLMVTELSERGNMLLKSTTDHHLKPECRQRGSYWVRESSSFKTVNQPVISSPPSKSTSWAGLHHFTKTWSCEWIFIIAVHQHIYQREAQLSWAHS